MLYLAITAVAHRHSGDPHRIESWNDKVLANCLIDYITARAERVKAEFLCYPSTSRPSADNA